MTEALKEQGWTSEAAGKLWETIESTAKAGEPLRAAFEKYAEATGRRPNSVRNYYYTALKQGACRPEAAGEGRVFTPFEKEQIQRLLREVLRATGNGESVRSCVTRLGGGDRALVLRYQNKYRSVLKSHPEWIQEARAELSAEGVAPGDPYARRGRREGSETACGAEAEAIQRAVGKLFEKEEKRIRSLETELGELRRRLSELENAENASERAGS